MIWIDHTAKVLNLKRVAIEQENKGKNSTRRVVMVFIRFVDRAVSI